MDNRSVYQSTYSLGQELIYLLKLHLYWLKFTLKGGILFGIFPACQTVIHALINHYEKKEPMTPFQKWFEVSFKTHFKKANQLGFLYFGIFTFLYVDLRIAGQLLKDPYLHGFLVFLFLLWFLIGLYLFPAQIRYHLNLKNAFIQSFFLLLSHPIETVAILVGIVVATALGTFFPILVLLGAVPLFLFPISWFSLQAMKKLESHYLKEEEK